MASIPLSDTSPFHDGPDSPIPQLPTPTATRWPRRRIILLASLTKCLVVFSGMLMLIPLYRLIEDALCRAHFDTTLPVDEMECKVDAVQSRLAYLLGWMTLLNSAIAFLVAYPYGMLSDRIGRRPVLVLSYAGLVASFFFGPLMLARGPGFVASNPGILFVGGLFQLVGGGVPVLLATLYSVAADVSSDKEKASSFLYLTFGSTLGGLLGPLLAGILMERYGPWTPIGLVLCLTPIVFVAFLLLPETLAVSSTKPPALDVRAHIRDLRTSLAMLRNRNIPLVLLTFLFQNVRISAYGSLLAQYISKHFGWRLAETSLLLSPLGILNLLILIALPWVSTLLTTRFHLSVFAKDLTLTRLATIALILGAFIQGASHSIGLFIFGLCICTFGSADSPLARATVSHYVAPEYTSRLYALIGMVDVVGSLIGGPVLAWLFDQGLEKKGVWIGLPWFYVSVLCGFALVALGMVRPPARMVEGEGEELDEQEEPYHD